MLAVDLTRAIFRLSHQGLRFVVPDVDVAVVERCEHPGFGRVQVAGLDTVGPGRQAALDVQSQRLRRDQGKSINFIQDTLAQHCSALSQITVYIYAESNVTELNDKTLGNKFTLNFNATSG